MLGRPRESARLGQAGLEVIRRYGIYSALLVSNQIEALFAIGDWDEAERLSAAALRGITSNFPYSLLIIRAEVEIGRGEFDAARAHLEAASATLRQDRAVRPLRRLPRRARPVGAPLDRRGHSRPATAWPRRASAKPRRSASGLCAKGLRAQAELAALARARRDAGAVHNWLTRARNSSPPPAARPRKPRRSRRTPRAGSPWPRPSTRVPTAPPGPSHGHRQQTSWERLERPPLAAYCRWRQAEALVAAGASRTEAAAPLRQAHAVAARIGARPLLRELELLAQRARLDLAPPQAAFPQGEQGPEEILGLTAREAEVLNLARPRLHQPRDRRDARDQRQDRQRPRLAHPAQARGAEQARGRRDRPPPRPATCRAT